MDSTTRYLDGAILCGPRDIGTETSQILLSGDEAAYARSSHLLDCLGGNVRYVGANVRMASTLDLAWLCESYGRFLAITHAACLCESEDVSFDLYATLFPENERVRYYADVIVTEDFDHCTATLSVWGAALQRIQQPFAPGPIIGVAPAQRRARRSRRGPIYASLAPPRPLQ